MKEKRIKWIPSLECGIPEIDIQHMNIVNIINMLYISMEEEKETRVLEEIIKELKRYTSYHFTTEEDLFQKFSYSDPAHIEEHKKFLEIIIEFEKKEISRETAKELVDFLWNWLYHHILHVDKKYSDFYHNR